MKIGDVKVGKEYALSERYGGPRHVQAVEIVTKDESVWSNLRETFVTRKEKQVKVKFLDTPPNHYDERKGSMTTVPARRLTPWEEVGPGIRERKERKEREDAAVEAAEKRVKKLLGRSYDGYVLGRSYDGYVVGRGGDAELSVRGRSLTKLLDLAEYGRIKKIEAGL